MKIFLLALGFCLEFSESARILGIFPTESISHQIVFRTLIKDLLFRGHEVTVISTDCYEYDHQNITTIQLQNLKSHTRKLNLVELSQTNPSVLAWKFSQEKRKMLDNFLSHEKVQHFSRISITLKFDVILLEYFNYSPILAFGEIFNCPVIGIVSLEAYFYVHEEIGNDANPLIHPDFYLPYLHGRLSLLERMKSLFFYLSVNILIQPVQEWNYKRLIEKHFPNITGSLNDLKNRVQFLMTNTHPAMGFTRPMVPNSIQLGFMHIEPPKPLAEGKLKDFLDNSKNGVIYMSLGSNVQSKDLKPEILKIFLRVFGSLNFDVLWKFEADDLPEKPENLIISKWTPQSDLLAHPKVKIFITQGGQQSLEEAIDREVPMIIIPFVFDQVSNMKRIVDKRIGFALDLKTMVESDLRNAIDEMLKPKYKENIKKIRDLVYDQPMTSRDKAVWWTEYVIRHKGAEHLQYPGRLVPFYEKL